MIIFENKQKYKQMEIMNFAEQKLLLFQRIMNIQNENKLKYLFLIVDRFLTNNDEDFNLTIEEWNNIFMEEDDLNSFISEYGKIFDKLSENKVNSRNRVKFKKIHEKPEDYPPEERYLGEGVKPEMYNNTRIETIRKVLKLDEKPTKKNE